MKRFLKSAWALLCSRATSPVVIGIFLMVYIVLAFATEETLTALMAVTASTFVLKALLALLPLSSAARFVEEGRRYLQRRKALGGAAQEVPEGLFDESVTVAAAAPLDELARRLEGDGYRTRLSRGTLGAWKGFSVTGARLLFLAATFSLYAGILISLTTRTVHRDAVVEGSPIPTASGGGGMVQRIRLEPASGAILAKDLFIEVAPSEAGDAGATLGLYPPGLYRGNFVYPRYLGMAPLIALAAPDLPQVYEAYHALGIYPAGKEDKTEIPGSPYRLAVSVVPPADGSDPFASDRATLQFKLLRGESLVLEGSCPLGGEFVRDGYRIAFPNWKRMATTDFVKDYGVILIWISMFLFLLSFCLWLPLRALFPRREMAFSAGEGTIRGYSRAEGERRRHGGIFHELLDLLDPRGGDGGRFTVNGSNQQQGNDHDQY